MAGEIMGNYWENRLANAQERISRKNEKQIEKQLRKYYGTAARNVISEFEKVYNKVLLQQAEGKQITPALLYRMDAYWKLQAQMRHELQKLGEREVVLFTKHFELNFFEVYHSINVDGLSAYTTLDTQAVRQMLNTSWVNDGKTFSQRIWKNTERLAETLNEQLINTIASGKKTTELKALLQERFGVSYRRADTLVRTELCHIQTEAARKRYEDYGIKYVEVLVDVDKHTCDKCKALVGKRFLTTDTPPLPVHPNERCCLVPVV